MLFAGGCRSSGQIMLNSAANLSVSRPRCVQLVTNMQALLTTVAWPMSYHVRMNLWPALSSCQRRLRPQHHYPQQETREDASWLASRPPPTYPDLPSPPLCRCPACGSNTHSTSTLLSKIQASDSTNSSRRGGLYSTISWTSGTFSRARRSGCWMLQIRWVSAET